MEPLSSTGVTFPSMISVQPRLIAIDIRNYVSLTSRKSKYIVRSV
ncbi:hypothetical protein BN903_24 [Halorubrum sp. AJ67]|nr:hypothetical protein BN903_24 [Halorubrum sp. AJ67]